MDVKTVCLGMLTFGEASGYDLKKFFESSFGHFFAAGYGSIYPALAYLAETELVTCEDVPQEGKPDRKVYRITDEGRKRLAEALSDPKPGHKIRSEFLAMMCFAHLMTQDQIERVLDHRIEEIDRLMGMFECSKGTRPEEWPVGVRFVAGFGRAMAVTAKDYIERNRHMLSEPDTDKKSAAGG